MTKYLTLILLSFAGSIYAFDIKAYNSMNAFELGEDLIKLPIGIHKLEPFETEIENVVIGIHGSNSEGYEWVYPLWKLNNSATAIYFYRWDDQQCANANIDALVNALEDIIDDIPTLKELKILAHSYGGLHLLNALNTIDEMVQTTDQELALEIHFIAALLTPPKSLIQKCGLREQQFSSGQLKIFNWKTIQKLDGAFREYAYDPQEILIPNSLQVRLPETYKGKKLGHNWSISWVADKLSSQ